MSRTGNLRDNQRARVYAAQDAAGRKVTGTGWTQTIPNRDLQAHVDKILAGAAFQRRWGQRSIRVDLGHGSSSNYYGTSVRFRRAHRNEWIVCHELAHCLTETAKYAHHGPEWAGVYLWLVRTHLGREAWEALRAEFKAHRVRYNNKAIPEPTWPVIRQASRSRAARVEPQRERAREEKAARDDATATTALTATRLRVLIGLGYFGEPGSRSRLSARATARRLEEATP